VIAIAPHRAAYAQRAIHRARQANREAAKTTRKDVLVMRLDDEVDVIFLNRELDDTKRIADSRRSIPFADGRAHLPEDAALAKWRKASASA